MKKQFSILAFYFFTIIANAQDSDIEKNITGVQIGIFGFDIYNETKIAKKLTLRTEASLFPAIWGGDMFAKTGFAFYPALTLQPKYYYNISNRGKKGKNTKNNSANYFGLQVRYIPDWFVVSYTKNLSLTNQIDIIPTYGLRRNFAKNFNYEFKAGIGYGTTIGNNFNASGTVADLSIKIGYDF